MQKICFSNNSVERRVEREEQREQFERRYHISAEDESNGHGDNSIQVSTNSGIY